MIPVVIARVLLAEHLEGTYPIRSALGIAGIKVFGLALVLCGIGAWSVLNNVYLEAVEEYVVFFILFIGLAPAIGESPKRVAVD